MKAVEDKQKVIKTEVSVLSTASSSPGGNGVNTGNMFKLLLKTSTMIVGLAVAIGLGFLLFSESSALDKKISGLLEFWLRDVESQKINNAKLQNVPEKEPDKIEAQISLLKQKVVDLKNRVSDLENRIEPQGKLDSSSNRPNPMKNPAKTESGSEQQPNSSKALVSIMERLAKLESNYQTTTLDQINKNAQDQKVLLADVEARISNLDNKINNQDNVPLKLIEQSSLMILSVSKLMGAISAEQKPFRIHLEALRLTASADVAAAEYIKTLDKYAEEGVLGYNSLHDRLKIIETNLLSQKKISDSGPLNETFLQLRSLVKVRKTETSESDSLETIFNTAYLALKSKRLRMATKIIKVIKTGSKDELKYWVNLANARLQVEEAISSLESIALSKLAQNE